MRKFVVAVGWLGVVAGIVGGCGDDAVVTPTNDGGAGSDSGLGTDSGSHVVDSGAPVIDAAKPTFTVGGMVSGLAAGNEVVLQNNAGDDLTVGANGAFTFSKPIEGGQPFAVTVKTSPTTPTQTCTVTGGTGTVVAGNVTSVNVNCVTVKYAVGGGITGLVGAGLVLTNNAGDDLSVNANGTFAFGTTVDDGSAYAVAVKTQPVDQTCTVAAGSGSVAGAPVTNVAVTCVTTSFSVGGTVSGLTGTVVLTDNGGDDLSVAADGSFTFGTKVVTGNPYAVAVKTQPVDQTCTVSAGSGTVGSAAVTDVAVTCVTTAFSVGGTVSGLTGTVVLTDNGGDDLNVTANGSFTFGTKVATGNAYAVAVKTQPANLYCAVANESGTMASAAVTNVGVNCTSRPELLYYRFDGSGTTVPNLASAPPAGTAEATIVGGQSQGGSGQCGGALIGNGLTSTSNYVNTGWVTSLTGSWTIAFWTSNVPSTTSTQYILGDVNAGGLRVFTGGVAGAGNWILRGPLTDVYATGGAKTTPAATTFVYDAPANEIRSYVDGVLISTVAQPGGGVTLSGTGPFKVGAYSSSASLPSGSLMDEFRFYNRALPLAEIQSIATRTCP